MTWIVGLRLSLCALLAGIALVNIAKAILYAIN